MKTAIILSGHMRTFDKCLPTLAYHVFRHFPGADFFVSTVKGEDSWKADLLREQYPDHVEIDVADEQPDCVAEMRGLGVDLPPEWVRGVPYTHEPYAISVHPQAVLRQLWQLQHAWEFYQKTKARDHEIVIRCRPDLWIEDAMVGQLAKAAYIDGALAFTPWWGRFGGVNDRFAVLFAEAAKAYFTTYGRIPSLMAGGCPLHPESLVKASLLDQNVGLIDTLRIEFKAVHANGSTKRNAEITMSDVAHLAASAK